MTGHNPSLRRLRIMFAGDVDSSPQVAVAFLVGPRAYDVFPLNHDQLDYWMKHPLPFGKVLIKVNDADAT
jgi:hypothetical protein